MLSYVYFHGKQISTVIQQGPRIVVGSEGAKIVLYFASHGGASMVDAGEESFIF